MALTVEVTKGVRVNYTEFARHLALYQLVMRKTSVEIVKQQARLFELRAAVALARLKRGQGRATASRQELAALSGWFQEGLDLPDHVEARDLLAAVA